MNREFLQLAKNFDPSKHGIAGWYVSEKLDGMRAYWDGGFTRNKYVKNVTFSNKQRKERLVKEPIATGLWSRYGNPIFAPDWFLDMLPEDYPLDGELYMGRGNFQEVMSTVKQFEPDERWYDIKYVIFDSPSDYMMFAPGKINNPNFSLEMPRINLNRDNQPTAFYKSLKRMRVEIIETDNLRLHEQERLPCYTKVAEELINKMLEEVTDARGEGLMLRKPEAPWEPRRVDHILKVKKLLDSEGVVIGYTEGKGKLEGLMGALVVKYNGLSFELSGFTNTERVMSGITNEQFPIGSRVTFRYTELSNDGIPLKARYWRKK